MVTLYQRNNPNNRRWFQTRERQSLTKRQEKRRIIPVWTLPSIISSLIVFYLFIFVPLLHAQTEQCQNHTDINDPICHPPPTWRLQDASQQCNIPRYSLDEFEQNWPESSFPVYYPSPIIVSGLRNSKFAALTTKEEVPNRWDTENVSLPKADLYSFNGQSIRVRDFVNLPETHAFDLAKSKPYMLQPISNFTAYNLVPSMAVPLDQRLGIGSLGSGAQWHSHGPGFCEVLHGYKHWALVERPTQPDYERSFVSRHWFEFQYASWKAAYPEKPKLWECTLGPGDAVYFPHHWFHTTVNLDPYTVFVTTFSAINKDRKDETIKDPFKEL